MQFTSAELRESANSVPSTSLSQYMVEIIESHFQREIAHRQLQCQEKINENRRDRRLHIKNVMANYGHSKSEAIDSVDDAIAHEEAHLRSECRRDVEQILSLRDYKLCGLMTWMESKTT